MSSILRRFPVLAGRGIAAAGYSSAAPVVLMATGAQRLATLPAMGMNFAVQQQQLQQLLCPVQSSRWYSAAAEAAEGPSSSQADSEVAAADAAGAGSEPAISFDSTPVSDSPAPAEQFSAIAADDGSAGNVKPPKTRLFVQNISWSTTDQALEDHFAQFGTLRSTRIVRRQDQNGNIRSLGFGFVEFEEEAAAAEALEKLNGSQFEGRDLTVREDHGQPPAQRRDARTRNTSRETGRPRRQWSNPEAPDTRVVVHGLPMGEYGWQDLKDLAKRALMEEGGSPDALVRVNLRTNIDRTSRGWGILHMATPEDAKRIIDVLDGSTLGSRVLTAKLDDFPARGQRQDGYRQRQDRHEGRYEDSSAQM